MQVSANDIVCIAGELSEQRNGAWTARIELDSEDKAITGAITIKIGDENFKGWVVRGETPEGQGRWIGHVIGGGGGLDKELGAKNYHRTTLRTVVSDALAEAKESLDSTVSDAAALASLQGHWTRSKGRTRVALNAVAKKIGGFWRVTRAGKVIFRKAETWQTVDFGYTYIDQDPSDGLLEIAPTDTPAARPGTTFDGHKVAAVRTIWSGAGVRQEIALVADKPEQARSTGELFAQAVKKSTENLETYSQFYRAKVISQGADGTIDLMPDDPRVRGAGLSRVEMVHGIPGLTVKVVPGSFVRLYYENGSPDAPRAALWPDGSSVQSVQLQALQEIVHVAPAHKFGPSANPTQSALRGEAEHAFLDEVIRAFATAIGTLSAALDSGASAATLTASLLAAQALKQAALSQFVKLE